MKRLAVVLFTLAMLGCNKAQFTSPNIDPIIDPTPTPVVSVYEHGFVTVQGEQFYNDGQQWQYRGATAFALFQRYLDGESISGLLDVYQQNGVNTVRVLGMWGFQDFNPARYGERYWTGLGEFADLLAAHNIRLEFVVFADAQRIIPDLPSQLAHFNRATNVLSGRWNVFIELANEYTINGIDDPRKFPRPTGNVSSSGSGAGEEVNGTNWDYTTYHPGRPYDWYDTMWVPNTGVPLVVDEPMGAAEFNQPGRRDNDPKHFYAFGKKIYTLNIAGATFHSEDGLYALPLGPTEIECMKQLFLGMAGK